MKIEASVERRTSRPPATAADLTHLSDTGVMRRADANRSWASRCRLRRLPETFLPDDAGLAFVFEEGWREHSKLNDRQPDTEDGPQYKSGGLEVHRNRLSCQRAARPRVGQNDTIQVQQ